MDTEMKSAMSCPVHRVRYWTYGTCSLRSLVALENWISRLPYFVSQALYMRFREDVLRLEMLYGWISAVGQYFAGDLRLREDFVRLEVNQLVADFDKD